MKRVTVLVTLLIGFMMGAAPLTVSAASKKATNEVVMKMGNKVHLFHSSKVDVQKEISIGDIITVYRESGKNLRQREVGQVKVLSFVGDHYFEGEIVKGEVKVGDVARKDGTSLLVQPTK